jgi:hypothetical protein
MHLLLNITEAEYFEMAKIDVLEERVNNHIRFFWVVTGAIIAALSGIGISLYSINGKLGDLIPLKGKVTGLDIQIQTSLPQAAFDKALPDIRSMIAAARKDRISVPPAVIEGLRSKLLASNSSAPDFWPTLSEFLSYRSVLSYHAVAAPTAPIGMYYFAKLPDCSDSLPKPMTIKEILSPNEAVPNRGLYENCQFVLDSPIQTQRINGILNNGTPLLTFKNCIVEYHGGEINLIFAWDKTPFTFTFVPPNPEDKTPPKIVTTTLSGPAIEFEDCLFEFSLQGPPPRRGQQISTALLVQDASSVALPVAK